MPKKSLPPEKKPHSHQEPVLETHESTPMIATKKKSPVVILGALAAVGVATVGVLFAYNTVTAPARIKDQTLLTQEVFSDYNDTLEDILVDLVDDDVDTADGLERALQDARDALKEAEEQRDKLGDLTGNISVSQLNIYKEALNEYISVSEEVITVQTDNVDLGDGYLEPFRKYEELNITMAGVSQYMFSDPSKYVVEVNKFLEGQKEIRDQFTAIEARGWFTEGNEVLIKTIDLTADFLKEVRDAVKDRSQKDIVLAQKNFAKKMQELENEEEKTEDSFDQKAEDLTDEIEDAYKAVEKEYDSLRIKYKL